MLPVLFAKYKIWIARRILWKVFWQNYIFRIGSCFASKCDEGATWRKWEDKPVWMFSWSLSWNGKIFKGGVAMPASVEIQIFLFLKRGSYFWVFASPSWAKLFPSFVIRYCPFSFISFLSMVINKAFSSVLKVSW